MPMIRYKPEQIDLGDRRHIPANKTDIEGWLLLPYLIWTGYAAILNFSTWRLNS